MRGYPGPGSPLVPGTPRARGPGIHSRCGYTGVPSIPGSRARCARVRIDLGSWLSLGVNSNCGYTRVHANPGSRVYTVGRRCTVSRRTGYPFELRANPGPDYSWVTGALCTRGPCILSRCGYFRVPGYSWVPGNPCARGPGVNSRCEYTQVPAIPGSKVHLAPKDWI